MLAGSHLGDTLVRGVIDKIHEDVDGAAKGRVNLYKLAMPTALGHNTYGEAAALVRSLARIAHTIGVVTSAEVSAHEGPRETRRSSVADRALAGGHERDQAGLTGRPHQSRLRLKMLRQHIYVIRQRSVRYGVGDGADVDVSTHDETVLKNGSSEM